jgi:hypothetical protein
MGPTGQDCGCKKPKLSPGPTRHAHTSIQTEPQREVRKVCASVMAALPPNNKRLATRDPTNPDQSESR